MKRSKYRGNRCHICGRECVPCRDNFGEPYMGCPVCVIVDPETLSRLASVLSGKAEGNG